MKALRVWLYALDDQTVPAWVHEELARASIELRAEECRDAEKLIREASGYDVLWLFGGGDNYTLTAQVLQQIKGCRVILRTGSGLDNVPLEMATQLGVLVVNTPEAVASIVADHSIALLLAIIRQIPIHDRLVRQGSWDRKNAWPDTHLEGQTVGLIGFGNISRIYVERLRGYNLTYLASDPNVDAETMRARDVEKVTLSELLRRSDVVTVHCNLSPSTHHLMGREQFRQMKRSAILINISRGPVVDEQALYAALAEGEIHAAAVDVLEKEPPEIDNPLLKLNNIVITPHIAALSDEYAPNSWRASVNALVCLSRGQRPRSVANLQPHSLLKFVDADQSIQKRVPSAVS